MENTQLKNVPIYRIIKKEDKSLGIVTQVIFAKDDDNKKLIMIDVCEMVVVDVFYDWEDFTNEYKLDVALRIYESIK
tara:strand:+ start:13135 stop:13365 length:231 start_codon:yes stop_codon:yes gene_type:complete